MIVTGFYSKINGKFTMHSPRFPYNSKVYSGYSRAQMEKKYRKDFNLKGKHIEWVIV